MEMEDARSLALDAAKDALLSCNRSVGNFKLLLCTHWMECRRAPTDDAVLAAFQSKAARMFGILARLYVEADRALSTELLEAITVANAAANNLPGVQIHGRHFATWHEASLEMTWGLLTIPGFAANLLDNRFDRIQPGQWVEQLEAVLAAYDAPDKRDYWQAVQDAVMKCDFGDKENIGTNIMREWANASAAITDQEAGGPWSQADTPTRWGKVFGISAATFVRKVKTSKIRAKKLSDRSYQVAIADVPQR